MAKFLELKAEEKNNISAYISQPSEKPIAGLVILQEIFGVNKHIKEVTDFYASEGYLSIAPALFDRIENSVELEYNENGVNKGRKLKELCDKNALKDIDAAISVVSSACLLYTSPSPRD